MLILSARKPHFGLAIVSLFSLCMLVSLPAEAIEGYYQQPTIAGDTIVFTAEGDLWIAPLAGGDARRLTTHEETETNPELSPDGTQVAFMATYDDGNELYVMPTSGGAPKRLTYYERVSDVAGWTDDGKILFVSGAVNGLASSTVIKAIDPDSGETETWPLANANQATIGARGTRYFTRYGLHRTGDHARMYRGGAMAQLWQFERRAREAERLMPETNANLFHPMWTAGKLFYLSDESGYFNLYAMGEGQLTSNDEWHVRHPDADGNTIVYQQGADLYRYDITSGESSKIDISLLTDYDEKRLAWVNDPNRYVNDVALAPKGDRVAIAARGQIAIAGKGKARRFAIPVPADARARNATIGPNGDWVYAVVGANDSEQIVRFAADGSAKSETLTRGEPTRRWQYAVSPDENLLAHSDHRGKLYITMIGSGQTTQIDEEPGGDNAYSLTWSADSRWLAYSMSLPGYTQRIKLYDAVNATTTTVTTERFQSYAPQFSKDGEWLYFLSDRHFQATPSSPWGDRNMGPMFDRRTRIYALALNPDAEFPFLPEELKQPAEDEPDTEEKKEGEDKEEEATKAVEIELDGLAGRLYEVPVDAGNFDWLVAGDSFLYVLDEPLHADNAHIKSISINADAKVETFTGNASELEISADGKQLMYRTNGKAYIVPAKAKAPEDNKELARLAVNLDGWALPVDRASEWAQMFDDAWRMHRDFSFDAGMRGLDWHAVREKYRPLVARVTHRDELSDLLGEMTGELGILHSQVRGGDTPEDELQPKAGVLGGEYKAVRQGLEITRIYRGDPDLPDERVPLASPHAGIQLGDVITSVNRQPVRDRESLAMALLNKADQVVELGIKRDREDERFVLLKPTSANSLYWIRYRDWEQRKRDEVAEASDNTIGYLHLFAMGGRDIADFAREYFAETQNDAIIFDARSNFGGNVDSWVLNELSRKAWAFWTSGTSNKAYGNVNMQRAFRGHIVMLIDARSYSDGETVAAGFKALDIGPLIGERTAGAGIWLTGRNRLSDRGLARIAEFGQFTLEGDWLVEGEGVTPDIEVINLPHETFEGRDRQLERAIIYLQERLNAEPVLPLEAKPIPRVEEGAAPAY